MQKRKGFTLIEIMLVVAIIGLLVAMVAPKLTGRSQKARETITRADVQVNMPLAIDLYEIDIGKFPESIDDLFENRENKDVWSGPYLKHQPVDPWGHDYIYTYPGSHNTSTYDVFSKGPDEQENTEDDIGNWKK